MAVSEGQVAAQHASARSTPAQPEGRDMGLGMPSGYNGEINGVDICTEYGGHLDTQLVRHGGKDPAVQGVGTSSTRKQQPEPDDPSTTEADISSQVGTHDDSMQAMMSSNCVVHSSRPNSPQSCASSQAYADNKHGESASQLAFEQGTYHNFQRSDNQARAGEIGNMTTQAAQQSPDPNEREGVEVWDGQRQKQAAMKLPKTLQPVQVLGNTLSVLLDLECRSGDTAKEKHAWKINMAQKRGLEDPEAAAPNGVRGRHRPQGQLPLQGNLVQPQKSQIGGRAATHDSKPSPRPPAGCGMVKGVVPKDTKPSFFRLLPPDVPVGSLPTIPNKGQKSDVIGYHFKTSSSAAGGCPSGDTSPPRWQPVYGRDTFLRPLPQWAPPPRAADLEAVQQRIANQLQLSNAARRHSVDVCHHMHEQHQPQQLPVNQPGAGGMESNTNVGMPQYMGLTESKRGVGVTVKRVPFGLERLGSKVNKALHGLQQNRRSMEEMVYGREQEQQQRQQHLHHRLFPISAPCIDQLPNTNEQFLPSIEDCNQGRFRLDHPRPDSWTEGHIGKHPLTANSMTTADIVLAPPRRNRLHPLLQGNLINNPQLHPRPNANKDAKLSKPLLAGKARLQSVSVPGK